MFEFIGILKMKVNDKQIFSAVEKKFIIFNKKGLLQLQNFRVE